ncbi:MAG: nucleotidyltransferase domain-containing protein [Acidimicrobiia bacterium]
MIPSLDGVVLAALAGTTGPLTLTTAHQLAGRGSLSGVRRVLLRLVRNGIVDEVPGGYVLNRDHVAAPAVERLAQLRGELFDRMRTQVAEWPGPPRLLGVFGSAARRDGDEDSDIDLLVVSDALWAADLAAELAAATERWSGNPTHVVTVSSKDLRRMRRAKEPILAEWERDLVLIVGGREALRVAS